MLLACGNDERPDARLGRARILSAGTRRELELDCWTEVMGKTKQCEKRGGTRIELVALV